MSSIDVLIDRLNTDPSRPSLAWRGKEYGGGWLAGQIASWKSRIAEAGVKAGDVVVLKGDYSATTIPVLLSLIAMNCIVCPLLPATITRFPGLIEVAGPTFMIDATPAEGISIERVGEGAAHPLYTTLRQRQTPGLVLFTSGSSGRPKGVVHDFALLLRKFNASHKAMTTIAVLMFDHWGGLNTLLHCLFSRSLIVLPENRTADHLASLIETFRIELLPATPTFLKLLLMSGIQHSRDLSSLKLVTYGAEPMSPWILAKLREVLPVSDLRQTYGLIELGVLRAKSRDTESLWMKVGGEGCDVRIVDGILQIKAESAMLGYLNAPSPFTEDGYFITGDQVEVDGDWIRVLGRNSDLINVGGLKVYPLEVENVIGGAPGVADALVYREKHPLLGHIVCADVQLSGGTPSDQAAERNRIKRYCSTQLEAFKVPVKIRFVESIANSGRMKRIRSDEAGADRTGT